MKNIFCAVNFTVAALLAVCSASTGQGEPSDAGQAPAGGDIPGLVQQLGHSEYAVREAADQKLRQLPPSAVKQLQPFLQSCDDPEVTDRIEQIIKHLTPTPDIDLKTLESVVIPEIDFRQVNIHDCLQFLEEVSAQFGPATTNGSGNRIRIVAMQLGDGTDVPLITFRARQINLLEALKILTHVANLQFRIRGREVIVEPIDEIVEPVRRPASRLF